MTAIAPLTRSDYDYQPTCVPIQNGDAGCAPPTAPPQPAPDSVSFGSWVKKNPNEFLTRSVVGAICAAPLIGGAVQGIGGIGMGCSSNTWPPYIKGFAGAALNFGAFAALVSGHPALGALGAAGSGAMGLYLFYGK